MLRIRSILPVMLALVATLLVSCGGGVAEAPPTYTPEKIATIEKAALPIERTKDRLGELSELINAEDWVNVDNLIHGPFGNLRTSVSYFSRQLLPDDQDIAQDLAQELEEDIDKIDVAAKQKNSSQASRGYGDVLRDLEGLLDLVPSGS